MGERCRERHIQIENQTLRGSVWLMKPAAGEQKVGVKKIINQNAWQKN
ncbi:Uncharacterized protein APZ42_023388 [Daphnia magna]|uniref:Uncharacterized protein n=1 Tax=Daphnia magna TaxID=35525 RepID=A0A164UZR9_9CRUS|nr:Uncharacterized protein APZ42_023388 [Daphnia magna]